MSGAIDRIGGQLTGLGCRFIARVIPEGPMYRKISLIWDISVKIHGQGVPVLLSSD
jgi:hypothetical protein